MKRLFDARLTTTKAPRLGRFAVIAVACCVHPVGLLAAIGYVQGNFATPQTPQTSVNVMFTAAQAAGDLNVVIVGWNDSSATVGTVSDTRGNIYALTVGPTIQAGVASQSIYYAKNIQAAVAGANTITVTFTSPAKFPDIRILEYSGADLNNPVDVTAANTGSSPTSNSGAVTTTNAADLLLGANLVQTNTTGAGASFTRRLLTVPDGDIAEDRSVAAVGSYSATAPLSSGQWIMQMVAFRAATSGGDTTPPTAPGGLTATASATQINLSWTASTDNVGVTGYRVERCLGAGCATFVQVATPSGTTYSDTGLAAGSYNYRVRATDAAGNLSAYSNVAGGVIPDIQAPTSPANLTATASGSQINLSWTASTDNVAVTGYLVEQCQGAGCTTFAQIASTTMASYANTGLAVGSYSYRVRAMDAAGNLSGYSNVGSATITDTTPPTAPGGLTATASATQINLSWTASTDNVGVTGYRVERCLGAGCATFVQVATPSGTTYSDTGLAAGSYNYRVRATDAAGNLSAYSNVAGGVIPDIQAPTSPANLTATASGSQINLSWTASTDNVAVTGYLVEQCQGAGCTTFAQIASTTMASYTNRGLAVGSYSYRVRATDAAGNLGPYSNTASATISPQSSTISYLQGNYATPQTPQTTVTVTFTAAQVAGDLNIVVVGWNDSTATVSAVTDTRNNVYSRAVGPTVQTGIASQSIYYAKNISAAAAGVNTVSVTFTGSAKYADIRILEYSGADPNNPVDVAAASIGTSANSSSGAVTTTNATDLLFGANMVQTTTSSPGSGFTERLLTSPDGDIAEDRMVTTVGSYSAIASLSSGQWIMQMVAFRAAASGGDTTPPTAPIGLTATASGTQINLSWTASTDNVGVTGYLVERCQGAGCTTFAQIATPTGTTYSDLGLASSTSYSYQVRAMDTSGLLGPYSNVASTTTSSAAISISPRTTILTFTRTQQFTSNNGSVVWSVDGIVGGAAASGTITNTGLYSPPTTVGSHTVTVAATSDPLQSASASVYITNYPGTFTRDIDTLRTGLNPNEVVLTPANVNSNQFGQLINYSLDGVSDASPLYVANVNVPGKGFHNIVYVATEHDSVYAFDADGLSTSPLWQVSFINPAGGITTIPAADTDPTGNCCDLVPEVGITGTPVIDPATGTLYLVAATKEIVNRATNYVHRIHALDITTGAEKFGGPFAIQASVPGNGAGASGGQIAFSSLREGQRPALLLSNGVIYAAFGGHDDYAPYHGWVFGFSAATLQQVMVYLTSPDGAGGGIWQSGDGLATDSTGRIYFVTGNGDFNVDAGGQSYGDSIEVITPAGVPADFFTPHDQAHMASVDLDLGSGGVLLLPDQSGPHPHLAISAGKNGTIYAVDRDNMGHFNSTDDSQIVQTLINVFPGGTFGTGNFKAPLYFNGYLYFSADADALKAFKVTDGVVSTSPTSQTVLVPGYPGATLSISANGTNSAILWAIQRIDVDESGNGQKSPGILHAFDATNVAVELYNTNQAANGRDTLDYAAKWAAPVVANGKVFVATNTRLAAFGLLP